ncbi:MAG: T9SS type B sorting domain-containing protein [Cytophagales bacterium]|nr:T9SS type B sorting domain-containing protein [Cytophagales bacterium]
MVKNQYLTLVVFLLLLLFMQSSVYSQNQLTIIPVDSSDVSCYGGSDGFLKLKVDGGTDPYFYQWNPDGSSGSSSSGDTITEYFNAGTYTITVIDAVNDTVFYTKIINQPDQIILSFEKDDVKCYGGSNDSATVNVSGGVGGYIYQWITNPVQTTKTVYNLTKGTYYVKVTDDNGCFVIDSVRINEPDSLSLFLSKTDVICYNNRNGVIMLNCSGGTKGIQCDYYYSINNSSLACVSNFPGLDTGQYIISAQDANNCITSDSIRINQPAKLEAQIDLFKYVTCHGGNDGYINLKVAGGLPPYSYNWNNGDTTIKTENLKVGFYDVQITDTNNCLQYISKYIIEPDTMYIDLNDKYYMIYGDSVGLKYDYNMDSIPLSFDWLPPTELSCYNCPVPNASPLDNKSYKVIITDKNGCTASDTTEIIVTEGKKIYIPNAFTPNGDGLNDVFLVRTLRVKDFKLQIYNRWGGLVFKSNNLTKGWNGKTGNKEKEAEIETYIYSVWIEFYDGIKKSEAGTVTVIR